MEKKKFKSGASKTWRRQPLKNLKEYMVEIIIMKGRDFW